MTEPGNCVTVGGVRRALAALTDDALAMVCVKEGRGRPIAPDAVSVEAVTLADDPGRSFAAVEVRVAEELVLGPRAVVADDALEVAWGALAESGACPLRATAALLARRPCASDCRARELGADCDAAWPDACGRGGE